MFLIGMWSSSYYLGNFLGPTVGGLLVDAYGFAWTAIVSVSYTHLTLPTKA